jgi:hypothetical protein
MKPGTESSTSSLSEALGTMEQRSEPRVRVDIAARLKCINPLMSCGPSGVVRIVELSYHGMKVRMGRELMPGVLVQIIVSGKVLMGTVRHAHRKGTEFETGVRLTERIPSCLE